jgi:1,5-anhydro-D-fructose reductase (1,5-anhydro-D-mannitol-forming)
MTKLRFGVCGLGCMGRSHFRRLRAHPRAEVVAVADQVPARRAGEWNDELGNIGQIQGKDGRVDLTGINSYADPLELVRDPRVDAVMIALPTPLHAPVAVAALQAGKHVLCEKPMANTPADCDRMIAAAEASGRTLMVAQCIRFWPQYELIKRYMEEGRIGKVKFVSMRRVGGAPSYSAGNWMLDGQQSGGALLDLHVHDVDFAQHMLGIPDTIFAHGAIGPSGGIDHIVASWGYADGRYAVIEGGWAPWPFDMEIAVLGEQGSLGWAASRGEEVSFCTGGDKAERLPCEGDAYVREDDYFIECALAGKPVAHCAPRSTRTSITLAWLERRAVEQRKQIVVNEHLRKAWEGKA